MDPFTQRLLERTRERREMLAEKMKDTSPRRKRSQPLSESQSDNMSSATSVSESDDSPNKRQCLREAEQTLKPDTPAIRGVRSRLQHLVEERGEEWAQTGSGSADHALQDDKEDENPAECLDDRPHPEPRSRKSRFAALANNINNWEDDLSRPQLKKDEKPRKVWQRPTVVESTEDSSNPRKPPRTFEHQSEPARQTAATKVVNRSSPAKPKRFISPAEDAPSVVSTLKVNLNSPASRSPAASPLKPSPAKPARTRTPQKRANSPVVVTSPARKSPRTSEENEPTKKPVSARLAHWQQKTDQVEAVKRGDNEPTAQSVSSRLAGWQQKVDKEASGPKSTPVRRPSPVKSTPVQVKPTVHVTKHDASPVKPTAAKTSTVQRSPVKSIVQQRSPVKAVSPNKVAPATKAIHERLQLQLQKNWQDNEIAEKARKQRETEMAALQNRWHNGVLKQGADDEQKTTSTEKEPAVAAPVVAPGTVPPAPPPPPASTTPKSNARSPKKTPSKTVTPASTRGKMSARRENQRDKLRNDLEATSGDGSPSLPNFESKLCAMGFETSGGSNVVTLDLTPQRERDYAARAAAAKNKSTPVSVKVSEKKITTTTFNDTTSKVKSPAPRPPTTTTTPRTATPGHSIYSIIKKQAGTTPVGQHTPKAGGTVQQRATPAPVQTSRRDSFDSTEEEEEESSFESEAYDESEGESQLRRQSSQNSTQSEQSQASQYGDAQSTTDYTSQTDTDYDTQDTENNSYASEEDDYETEDDASGISDLLDEAMDETTTEAESDVPVPAPRRARQQSQDLARRAVVSRSPTKARPQSRSPTKAARFQDPSQSRAVERRHHAAYDTDKRVTWAAGSEPTSTCSSASESEPERRLVYSLDLYRSDRDRKNGPTPRMTIVRHSEHYHHEDSEDELPFVPEKNVRQRLQELQDAINQEQSVIMQTSNALNQCCHVNSAFAGSAEAVECHRLLLLACKKREAYLTEMSHLRENHPQRRKGLQGSLTISDLRLPLKKDFQSRLTNSQGGMQIHYFLILVRHESHVIFTQMVSTQEAARGCLDFPNLIKFSDIRQGFKVDLEVYGMYLTKEAPGLTPKKKKGLTPKKSKSKALSLQSPGGPMAVRSTNFVCVAHMPIVQQSINKTHFNLDGVPYSSPLQGTIHLKLRCVMENNVEERGFLTMFEDVSGFGAWHRRWCVLKNDRLSYWKYPEEERLKEPMGYIEFKTCISDNVGVIPRDICARPNTFELRTVRRQARGETDTLVSRCYNTMTTTKHWISADLKEDRIAWCKKINEALCNLRTWNPDALRPIKRH